MANIRAVKVALVVAGVLLAVLFAGQLLRRVTMMLSWGMLVGLVLLVAYGVYELQMGWTSADEAQQSPVDDDQTAQAGDLSETDAGAGTNDGDDLDALRSTYVETNMSDEEFEAELERLLEETGGDLEVERSR